MRPAVRTALLLAASATPALAQLTAAPQHGEALYRRHCASCHGVSGHGDGPVAPYILPRPSDLTRSTLTLPALMEVIDGRRTVRGHGTAAMPVWGAVFEQELAGDAREHRQALRQVQAIAEWTETLRLAPSR
jgi:mono/diheme cytochrome c family protein